MQTNGELMRKITKDISSARRYFELPDQLDSRSVFFPARQFTSFRDMLTGKATIAVSGRRHNFLEGTRQHLEVTARSSHGKTSP
jgi:hypothetical protein